jgi:hypothetical protein
MLLWQVLVLLALLTGASTSELQATSSSNSNRDNSKQKNDEYRSLDLNTPSRKLTELITVESETTQQNMSAPTQPTMPTVESETTQQNMSAPTQPTTPTSFNAAPFNATAFSFTACEKIDLALQFITSLDFDEHFHKALSASPRASESDFFRTIYLLQWILTPISLGLLLFGARLFLHTCVLCAATGGLFTVFGFVDTLLPTRYMLDCPMKLALSVVVAFISAVMATAFFRFALFSFGALTLGGLAYTIFDSFPQLDPGVVSFSTTSTGSQEQQQQQQQLPTGDLSTVAWVITIFLGGGGGMILRYYEQETLEIMTAGMGGVGCAYSIHTFLLLNQITLDPSVVFLLAFFISVGGTYPVLSYPTMLLVLCSPRMDEILVIVFNAAIISERIYFCLLILTFFLSLVCMDVFRTVHFVGWRFQRRRRLNLYTKLENYDGQQLPIMMHPMAAAAGAGAFQQQQQLEQSLRGLLQFQTNEKSPGGASSEQMTELTQSVNKFLASMEAGQKDKSDKDS